ncbi:MAG TPA: AarF/UbiB family protein, partial [Pyrinomonadaceae bacterium]|nr:AarF/UbiB family protein [Pyrinomonadaceae bacterium]
MQENKQGLTLLSEPQVAGKVLENGNANAESLVLANGNGAASLPVKASPNGKIAVSTEESRRLAAAKLEAVESSVGRKYQGWRGWWRLLVVSSVIGRLALYLYLDRYDITYKYYRQHVENRFERARQMNFLALLGEYLLEVYRFVFDKTIRLVRWFALGRETNKERNQEKQAIWLKKSIIKLGPTFIKIGQALGTRADLLPLSYVKELGSLQDDVPSFPNEIAFARIEAELGKTFAEAYAEFDVQPIAAASLGQVYRARLHSGEEVAVKVQRRNLTAVIRGDIDIMQKIAKFAERFPALNENADWAGMLGEFDE